MVLSDKEINFDRFVRGLIALAVIIIGYLLLKYLSPVLVPFFVAWFLAYLLYPIVRFLEVRCRLKNRILCIFLTVGIIGGIATLAGMTIIPPFLQEMSHLENVAKEYVNSDNGHIKDFPLQVQDFAKKYLNEERLTELLQQKNVQELIQKIVPQIWGVVRSTAVMVVGIASSLIGLLYFFFLLMDYERFSEGWKQFIPQNRRKIAVQIVRDVERNMNGYFRGQALVALSNCIMFSLGFWLIGFPVPLALGCFIGIISFVPYLQLIGFLPAVLLAFLRTLETGQNFWLLIGGVCLVYIVVQIIQDTLVTPQVMGKIMGLRPAIVLLALTVWGYMLGIIGLIIALPLTTLLIAYYRNYFIGSDTAEDTASQS